MCHRAARSSDTWSFAIDLGSPFTRRETRSPSRGGTKMLPTTPQLLAISLHGQWSLVSMVIVMANIQSCSLALAMSLAASSLWQSRKLLDSGLNPHEKETQKHCIRSKGGKQKKPCTRAISSPLFFYYGSQGWECVCVCMCVRLSVF